MNNKDFMEKIVELDHVGNHTRELYLSTDDLETFDYLYKDLLKNINDEGERTQIEFELIMLIKNVVEGHKRNVAKNNSLPTKEKRNKKLMNLIKAIDTVIASMQDISGDLERESNQQQYLKNLRNHRFQVVSLYYDVLSVDVEFGTIDYSRRDKVDKTKVRQYLEKVIQDYNIKITKKDIDDIIRETPPKLRNNNHTLP